MNQFIRKAGICLGTVVALLVSAIYIKVSEKVYKVLITEK